MKGLVFHQPRGDNAPTVLTASPQSRGRRNIAQIAPDPHMGPS